VNAAVSNTDDLTLTARDNGVHFTVALRGKLAEIASHTVTTPMLLGCGVPESVKELERVGRIFDGVTTEYVKHGNPDEYGRPDSFVDHTQYDIFTFEGLVHSDTPLPMNAQHTKKRIVVALPKTATPFTPSNDFSTVFGLTLNA
jgi:hypothetical protein